MIRPIQQHSKRRLRGRRAVLDDQLTSVRRELEELEARRSELAEQIGHIDALLMERPAEKRADPADSAGARSQIADMVVAGLTELDRPLHYREIEKELRARGVEGGGQDPANTPAGAILQRSSAVQTEARNLRLTKRAASTLGRFEACSLAEGTLAMRQLDSDTVAPHWEPRDSPGSPP